MKRRYLVATALAVVLAAILVPAAAARKPVTVTPDHYQGPVSVSVSQPVPVTPHSLGLTPEQAFGSAAANAQAADPGRGLAAATDPRASGCWVAYVTQSGSDFLGVSSWWHHFNPVWCTS